MNIEELTKLIKEKELEKNKIDSEINKLKEQQNKLLIDLKEKPINREESIKTFMSYFRGRNDVYPYFSVNKNNPNIKYYTPACANEWKKGICNKTIEKKCKECRHRENKPLTKDIIYKHMYDKFPIGIYPLLEDGTCYFLALDFDDKKTDKNIKNDVLSFASVCDTYGVPIAIERSRSGNGIHIWIFFETNIKAFTARKLGGLLLSKTMETTNISISTFDRMFPNQDILPKGGYGNLIALPFQNEPAKKDNTLFVDRNFTSFKNQIRYLKTVHKLTEEEVFQKIKKISNNTIDISHEIDNMNHEVLSKGKNNIEYPTSINVSLNDMIYISKENLTGIVKNSFKRLATFANPVFYKNQNQRKSVYNIPMVIDCSEEDEKFLKLPRGTYDYLENLCNINNVKIIKKDKRFVGNRINVKFKGNLKEEQQLALAKLLEHDTGILSAPPGFGKTVIGCKLIEEKKVNTLVLVSKIQLLNQWKDRIKQFLEVEEIGEYHSKKKKITNTIDIASIKSLWNKGNISDIFKNYGMIIIDECHGTAAYTYEKSINTGNAKYVYGISATPEREDGHTPIVKMQCGEIRYKVDTLTYNKNLNIPMKVVAKKSHLNFVNPNINDYSTSEILDLIAKDVIRNDKIIEDIKKEYQKGKNILVLTDRIMALDYFYPKLAKVTENIFKYQGGMDKKALEKYSQLNNHLNETGENKIIVASSKCIGEGFDDPKLDVLFLTMPISGKSRIEQYTGRLHRKEENKKEIVVYDYIDDNFEQTRKMFLKRKIIYKKLGYEIIKEENIF